MNSLKGVAGVLTIAALLALNIASLANLNAVKAKVFGSGGGTVVTSGILPITLSNSAHVTGTLPVANGGTNLTSYTLGTVLYASGTGTLAGTTTANLKTTLALNNVENTALSTWAGSTNLTTLGTVTTGTWNAVRVEYPSFTYATSTAFTGTTTIPLGPAFTAETWNNTKCTTDAGTLFVQFSDGTNHMDDIQASTTVGTITFSANNSFTAGEKREVRLGTPASSPTKISCTVKKTINSD